MIIFHSLLI